MKRILLNIRQESREQASKILELMDSPDEEAIYLGCVCLVALLEDLGLCIDTDLISFEEWNEIFLTKSCINSRCGTSLSILFKEGALRSIAYFWSTFDNKDRSFYTIYAISEYIAKGAYRGKPIYFYRYA